MKTIKHNLKPHQKLYIAGAFEGNLKDTAWFVQGSDSPQPDPAYYCEAEETDTRIWLHARENSSRNILIVSADTDIYHIGCPLLQDIPNKHIVVQLSKMSSRELKYLDINALKKALANDPDLAHMDSNSLPQVMQTMYLATGCDYISFFSRIGKTTFLKYFFQHATFISSQGDESTPGSLSDVDLHTKSYESGFLAFLRLIGFFSKCIQPDLSHPPLNPILERLILRI